MRPCQQCGRSLESNVALCPECGREQVVTVGLETPTLPRWRPTDPELDECDSADRVFRVFAAGVAICVSVALGFLVWVMFGPMPAVMVTVFAFAIIGSILNPLF